MVPRREALTQLARLIGGDEFTSRFGSPQNADPDVDELSKLVDKHLDDITRALVAEAVSSDDVLDAPGAMAYLDDRLRTLAHVFSEEQASKIQHGFARKTEGW